MRQDVNEQHDQSSRARRACTYPSDLTDAEWAVLAPVLPPPKGRGRPRMVDLRAVLDGIRDGLRTGCQWRALPRDFPKWPTVYAYLRRWERDGTWAQVHATLRARVRVAAGREPTPSAAILDSQSVKTVRGGRVASMGANG